jgi:hypothetical protein
MDLENQEVIPPDTVAPEQPTESQPGPGQEPKASATEAFLNTLSDEPGQETPEQAAIRARDELGRFATKPAGQPGAAAPGATPSAATPAQPTAGQPPLDDKAKQDQEDAELLAGINSGRGRERVQKLITERNETRAQADQVTQSLGEIQQIVQSAGMDANQFAEHIEFARLANSNDPQNLRVAAQMIEEARSDIYKRLGVDAPGVDVLADFPDLAQKVNNFEMDRQSALEVAQLRRRQQQIDRRQEATQQQQQASQQNVQAFNGAMGQVETYLTTRSKEADHPARMEIIGKYFKDPANIQEFLRTYQPQQMAAAIKWMYNNVQVAPAPVTPNPLRARPTALGSPAANANADPMERMFSHLDQMGI